MPPRSVKQTVTKPPKRRRGQTSTSGQVFHSDIARQIYNTHLHERAGIRERGVSISSSDIRSNIAQRQWDTFVSQPEVAVLPLVREFYANARVQLTANPRIRQILVRGRMVPFDRATINQVFNLENIEHDDYSALLDQDPDYDGIISCLARAGSSWKLYREKPVNFMRNRLLPGPKAWHYFISARLLPSNHVSDVTLERAVLNFAIQTRLTIDVGKVIEESIIAFATGRLSSSLGHPSLICHLCSLAAVAHEPDEETQIPLPPLDDVWMRSIERTDPTAPRVSATDAPPHRRSTTGASSSQSAPQHEVSLGELHHQIQELRLEHDRTRRTQRRHSRQLDYVVDVCKAMVTAYQSGTMPTPSSTPVFFPAPPSPASYRTESEESDEESE